MMLVLQVYKLAYSEWQNSLLGLRIIVEKTSYQHQRPSSQVDFGGVFGMHQHAPLTTAFALVDTLGSRGSPSTSATTTTAFDLAFYFADDGYGLRPHLLLQRRLLRPSPSPTQLGSRGSPSTLATMTSAFTLVDTVRLEGLAFYFGDDDFSLHPR